MFFPRSPIAIIVFLACNIVLSGGPFTEPCLAAFRQEKTVRKGHSDGTRELWDLMRTKFALPKESIRLEFENEWSIEFPGGGGPKINSGPYKKQVVLELYSTGALIENVWSLNSAEGGPPEFPIMEIHFDGHSLLQLMVGDRTKPANLYFYPRPTLSQSRGMRGDAILAALGLTATYNDSLWSIWDIAETGRMDVAHGPGSIAEFVSDGEFGKIRAEVSVSPPRLLSLEIYSTRPGDWWHGTTLQDANLASAVQSFSEFVYIPVSEHNRLGIGGWRTTVKQTSASGRTHVVDGQVRVLSCKLIDSMPPDLKGPLRLMNSVPDGTSVSVIDIPHMTYTIRDGRLQVPEEPEMENQLSAVRFESGHVPDHRSLARLVYLLSSILAIAASFWLVRKLFPANGKSITG